MKLFWLSLPVAFLASCSGSLIVGLTEATLGSTPDSSLFVESASAVLGLAFAATFIAFPITLLALWMLIIPITLVLSRLEAGYSSEFVLIALGICFGWLISRLLDLEMGLHTDGFIGAIYGGLACLIWVLALRRAKGLQAVPA